LLIVFHSFSFYLGNSPGKDKLSEFGVLQRYAEKTEGFSAADLKNFCNEVCSSALHNELQATMRAIKEVIEVKKAQGQDANILVDPEKCNITEEHLQSAFVDVIRKVKGERILPEQKLSGKLSKIYGAKLNDGNNSDPFDLD
jgi:SpoVK/Ycf46/Vps4 family AAA+-type ATPase